MQYFTPTRLLALQDVAEERKFYAAHEEWERAVQGYKAHLREVEAAFPRSVRRLLARYCLHDALVLAIEGGSHATLTITLRLDPPEPFLLVLTYSLVGEPEIDHHALPEDLRSIVPCWLYSEFDLVARAVPNHGRQVCAHDILLSNGWEMKIHFWKLVVSRPKAFFPAPDGAGEMSQSSVSQSA